MKEVLELGLTLIVYDLIVKESIVKPLVVNYTQNKIKKYLPELMELLDNTAYEALQTGSLEPLSGALTYKKEELSDEENDELFKLANKEFNIFTFVNKFYRN